MSCIPCTDEINTLGKIKQITQVSTGQHSDAQEFDLCSPLCVCSCCGGFMIGTIHHYSALYTAFAIKAFSLYKQDFTHQLSYSIWQPPKL